jgi:NAD+ synthase
MDCENVKNQITEWLTDYNNNTAKTKGFVVGVSGGVDSGLVSTLCAITGIKTILVELPINRKESEITTRASEHCNWLKEKYPNVEVYKIDLSIPFNEMLKTYPNDVPELTYANLSSRIRMCSLYMFSNTISGLVVGTGNKIEDTGISFFSRYGDGGVDISPIGDLMKSEVRELASFLGVSEAITKAVPTDELWSDSRSDESQLGASYDDLEWAMKTFESMLGGQRCYVKKQIRDNGSIDGCSVKVYDEMTPEQKKVFNIFITRHVKYEFKNNMPPVCYVERN